MATKNVYFFEMKLYHDDEEININDTKIVIEEIVNGNAIDFGEYKSLDITPYEEDMHIMMDIYDYKNNYFFTRMSKQKPSNSMVQHDYRTYEKEDVLPGNDENERGIEQYTYGMLDYAQGIFMVASTMGAPSEKVINNLFVLYAPEYVVGLTPIPNARAIESIYEGEESEITKLEIEVPLPALGTLENVFNWEEDELLEVLNERNLSAAVVIKPLRGKSITHNKEETTKVMDFIKENLHSYNKAKMKAKARNLKLRDYNFFEDNFSYPIDIQNSYVRDRERIYYTVDQLVDIYRRRMRTAYIENERLLRLILGR